MSPDQLYLPTDRTNLGPELTDVAQNLANCCPGNVFRSDHTSIVA